MAFPYTAEFNFETGDNSEFTSETDANSILNVRHYRRSAALYPNNPMPYRGAYQCEVNLDGADTNQYLQYTQAIAQGSSLHVRFLFHISSDIVMGDGDRLTMFAFQNSSNTDEVAFDLRYSTSLGYEVLAGETGATAYGSMQNVNVGLGEWHQAEISATIDSGSDDGTIDAYIDNTQIGSQVTSLTQADINHFRLGAIGVDTDTTKGRIHYSELTLDDARVYPYPERFPANMTITKSQHAFVGPGAINLAALFTTNSDNVLRIHDTDTGGDDYAQGLLVELDPDAHTSFSGELMFEKGCYVTLAGTNPRGQVGVVRFSETPGIFGPYTNEGMIRHVALS